MYDERYCGRRCGAQLIFTLPEPEGRAAHLRRRRCQIDDQGAGLADHRVRLAALGRAFSVVEPVAAERLYVQAGFAASARSRTLASRGSSGVMSGEKRARTVPSRPITNFSKFQSTSESAPGFSPYSARLLRMASVPSA